MAADPTPVPYRLVVCTPLLAEYVAVRWGIRRGPRWAQPGPRWAQPGPRWAQRGPRWAHSGRPLDSPPADDPRRVRVVRTGMGPGRSRSAAALSHSLTAGRYADLAADLSHSSTAGPTAGPSADPAARRPPASVVVAGVAGALTPDLSPGEVVVAGHVLGDDDPTALPDAPGLAWALRAAGLSVHVGPVVSTTGLRADRAALHAETGAVAVDLESAFLARALREAPMRRFAVVRVVVDTPSAPLVHPRTVPNGVRALRALARVATALPAWAAAASASRHAPARV